jgi:hypothetical protein
MPHRTSLPALLALLALLAPAACTTPSAPRASLADGRPAWYTAEVGYVT